MKVKRSINIKKLFNENDYHEIAQKYSRNDLCKMFKMAYGFDPAVEDYKIDIARSLYCYYCN